MGESTDSRTTLRFDRRVRLEFHGSTITSDAGLLACRELDDALGLTETATACLQESRGGRNVQHELVALLRQSVYSRLAGYEDTNDAERLAQDPAMRVIVGRRGLERQAASTNTMSRFETEVLTRKHNPEGLARMNAQWVDRAMAHTSHRRVILDMDSSKSPVHGEQEGAAYNGHFGCTCYHPIFVFNQFGDCEGAMLRPGNVHSAHNWREVLDPIVARYGRTGVRRYFRADAAFAKPEVYEYLEERRVLYAIRLPRNEVLQWEIAPKPENTAGNYKCRPRKFQMRLPCPHLRRFGGRRPDRRVRHTRDRQTGRVTGRPRKLLRVLSYRLKLGQQTNSLRSYFESLGLRETARIARAKGILDSTARKQSTKP